MQPGASSTASRARRKSTPWAPTPSSTWRRRGVELGEVKALLLENKDPVTERRVSRAATAAGSDNTFKAVAQEWLAMKQREWSGVHYAKSTRAFERDVYPAVGNLPIASITPAIVTKAIEDIHKRDVLETATRILQHLNGVFRYAQAKGLCRDNPAGPAREILPRKKDSGRMPALLDFAALGEMLRRAEMA
ncbi:MAG: tyrosine-type recombinase/integrase, partial [Chromatiales bacterium]